MSKPFLYAPSIPLTPEPLASVRARRRADRSKLKLALALRSPFTVGGYVFLALLLPYMMNWATSRCYFGFAFLGLVTLWRAYLVMDAQIGNHAFSEYETVDGFDNEECHLLLAQIPEGAAFRSAVLEQGRYLTRTEFRQIRQRADYLRAQERGVDVQNRNDNMPTSVWGTTRRQ